MLAPNTLYLRQATYSHQRGAILLVSLLLMLGMAVIAISSSDGMQIQKQLAVSNKMNKQAYQASASGNEWAVNNLKQDISPLMAILTDDITDFSDTGPFAAAANIDNQIDIQRGKLFVPSGVSISQGQGFKGRIFELRSQATVGSGDKAARSNQIQAISLLTPQG